MTAPPDFSTIRDGLLAVVQTVTAIKQVLPYEPSSVQVEPLAWILLDSYTRSTAGQVVPMRYRFVVRVASPLSGTVQAEDTVVEAAIEVANAVDRNPQFTGVLVNGFAQSFDGATGWVLVGGVKCRVIDVFVSALSTGAYGS